MGNLPLAASEFSDDQLNDDPILRYFGYLHLPVGLQRVSVPFCQLAAAIVNIVPCNAERSVALRKLLEAKDAAVRANVGAAEKAETFYDRLLAESRDLENKIEKLDAFLNGKAYFGLSSTQQDLLHDQRASMRSYADTLGLRIKTLADERPPHVEEIDQGVRLVGGDQSETPPPFK